MPLSSAPSTPLKTEQLAFPVVVVGSGIAGLFAALKLSEAGQRVLLISKSKLSENNSRYAQGGIAAVLPDSPDDSLEKHVQDTVKAGAGLADEAVARSILGEGYAAVLDLLAWGVPFDKQSNGELALTREAAHSVQRIIHAGGDATGYSVEMTLIDKVRDNPNIHVLEFCMLTTLRKNDAGRCVGCEARHFPSNTHYLIQAPHVVLATGGIGRLYTHTTNPTIATGDGIAVASRIGAELKHMEFLQFHPTAFYDKGQVKFLISEALRGEGGRLLIENEAGQFIPFAHQYHPDGELAPRDIVTRAIFTELQKYQRSHAWLDITHLPHTQIENRFPTILKFCLEYGFDIRAELIPVAPAAHYMMGGIAVDLNGQSSIPGLYAIGETSCTGLHGANRLASNSLLECVVQARRVAHLVTELVAKFETEVNSECPTGQITQPTATSVELESRELKSLDTQPLTSRAVPEALLQSVQQMKQLMWTHVGIVRTHAGLEYTLAQLNQLHTEAEVQQWQRLIPKGLEYTNQLLVARALTEAALSRKQSLGAHCREENTAAAPLNFPSRPLNQEQTFYDEFLTPSV